MARLFCIKVLFCSSCFLINGFAQGTTEKAERPRIGQQNRAEQMSKSSGNSSTASIFTKRGALPFKKRLSRAQKKLLEPDVADLNSHAAFLRNPNTGLIKLFPDIGCEDNANVVRVDADCLQSIPMSAFYSFREKEHTTDYLSDIRLENDRLITDGILTQGILVELGEADLDKISTSSDGVKFLTEYQPKIESREAYNQTLQLAKGIKSGDYLYRKSLPAKENTTYALRVIAYRGAILQTWRGFLYNMLAGDERADITVVFRVLRKNEAGVYTLLWKELTRKDSPKVVFPKKSKRK